MNMLISLMAVYLWDNTVLDNFTIPDGMNRNTFIHELLHETAELSLVYSEPQELKESIKNYSNSRIAIWQKLYDLSIAEYNPLENYDRAETKKIQHGHRENTTYSNTIQRNSSVNNKVYGFDSEQATGKDTSTGNGSGTDAGTNAIQHSGEDVEITRAHGNIGVTSYQQMIEGEYAVRQKLDMYKYIIEDFKHQFCICIY